MFPSIFFCFEQGLCNFFSSKYEPFLLYIMCTCSLERAKLSPNPFFIQFFFAESNGIFFNIYNFINNLVDSMNNSIFSQVSVKSDKWKSMFEASLS